MKKQAVKNILYGGIAGIMSDPTFYREYSDPRYATWTDDGKKALQEFIEMISIEVAIAEKEDITTKAKELTLKGLKGENV